MAEKHGGDSIQLNRKIWYITLAPNSTKLARFCNALAISFNVLAAVSEGVSEKNICLK